MAMNPILAFLFTFLKEPPWTPQVPINIHYDMSAQTGFNFIFQDNSAIHFLHSSIPRCITLSFEVATPPERAQTLLLEVCFWPQCKAGPCWMFTTYTRASPCSGSNCRNDYLNKLHINRYGIPYELYCLIDGLVSNVLVFVFQFLPTYLVIQYFVRRT